LPCLPSYGNLARAPAGKELRHHHFLLTSIASQLNRYQLRPPVLFGWPRRFRIVITPPHWSQNRKIIVKKEGEISLIMNPHPRMRLRHSFFFLLFFRLAKRRGKDNFPKFHFSQPAGANPIAASELLFSFPPPSFFFLFFLLSLFVRFLFRVARASMVTRPSVPQSLSHSHFSYRRAPWCARGVSWQSGMR